MAPIYPHGNFAPTAIKQPPPKLIAHAGADGHPNVATKQFCTERRLAAFRRHLAFAPDLQQRSNLVADVRDEIEFQSAASNLSADFSVGLTAPYPPNLLEEALTFLGNRNALGRLRRRTARDLPDCAHQNALVLRRLRVEELGHEGGRQRFQLQAVFA